MNDYHIPFTINIPGTSGWPTYLDVEPALKKFQRDPRALIGVTGRPQPSNIPLGISTGYGEYTPSFAAGGGARTPAYTTPYTAFSTPPKRTDGGSPTRPSFLGRNWWWIALAGVALLGGGYLGSKLP